MQTIRNLIRESEGEMMRFLLAEDEHSSCLVLETALTHEGYQVLQPLMGRRLWTQPRNAYDLMILDIMMPVKTRY